MNPDPIAKRQSSKTSLLIGGPIGVLTVLFVLLFPVMLTGEGLTTIAILGGYQYAIIGLLISFIIALWLSGKTVYADILKGKKLIQISFKYSWSINLIIWSTFIIVTVIDNFKTFSWLLVVPPFFAFFICTGLTTFTLGLLICYIIKRQMTNLAH